MVLSTPLFIEGAGEAGASGGGVAAAGAVAFLRDPEGVEAAAFEVEADAEGASGESGEGGEVRAGPFERSTGGVASDGAALFGGEEVGAGFSRSRRRDG